MENKEEIELEKKTLKNLELLEEFYSNHIQNANEELEYYNERLKKIEEIIEKFKEND